MTTTVTVRVRVGEGNQREKREEIIDGISRVEEEVLGRTFLGDRVWGMELGNVTEEMINQYLEHHRTKPNSNEQFILEE